MILPMFRRALVSLGVAGMVATGLRAFRPEVMDPISSNGWRELRPDELITPTTPPTDHQQVLPE